MLFVGKIRKISFPGLRGSLEISINNLLWQKLVRMHEYSKNHLCPFGFNPEESTRQIIIIIGPRGNTVYLSRITCRHAAPCVRRYSFQEQYQEIPAE